MITPLVLFNVIMQVIAAFQAFNSVFIISGGTGGPLNSTLLFSLYLYQMGFANFEMGYAAALAWVLLIIIALITGLIFWTSKKWAYNQDGCIFN